MRSLRGYVAKKALPQGFLVAHLDTVQFMLYKHNILTCNTALLGLDSKADPEADRKGESLTWKI